jgi:hypothetical protein
VKPGKDLDILMATRVRGAVCDFKTPPYVSDEEADAWWHGGGFSASLGADGVMTYYHPNEVPRYSEDAREAVGLLASWPGDLHLHRRRGEWRCALYPAEPSADEWVARGATPALAICGALLKAKGVEVAGDVAP